MTVEKMHEGLNETNRVLYMDSNTGTIADDGTWGVTVPEYYRGKAWIPVVLQIHAYGAGAVGARTATLSGLVGDAQAGVAGSYVEATGVLTLTNRSAAALVTPRVIFQMMPTA